MNVVAVVVSYNRPSLLGDVVQSLLAQTKPLNRIWIIDNNSNLETQIKINELESMHSILRVLRLNQNTGGAGGFAAGTEKALTEKDCDWVWYLDDDVVAKANALERMLSFSDISKCIQVHRGYRDGSVEPWEGYFDPTLGRMIWFKDTTKLTLPYVFVNYGCFEGMLIHTSIIEKIGIPDRRFFFVYDDLIYGYLASFFTHPVLIRDTLLIRQLKPKPGASSVRSCYYIARNGFLVREYLEQWSPTFHRFGFIVFHFGKVIKESIFHTGSIKRTWALIQGLADGIRGRFGRGRY